MIVLHCERTRDKLRSDVDRSKLIAGAVFAAGQFGTSAEAKAMLDKAVAELKTNETAALAKTLL